MLFLSRAQMTKIGTYCTTDRYGNTTYPGQFVKKNIFFAHVRFKKLDTSLKVLSVLDYLCIKRSSLIWGVGLLNHFPSTGRKKPRAVFTVSFHLSLKLTWVPIQHMQNFRSSSKRTTNEKLSVGHHAPIQTCLTFTRLKQGRKYAPT
jgi:hypothetical protein